MEFSADKCEVIRITTEKNPIIYPYQIHQTTLRLTDQAKYLGVTIALIYHGNATLITLLTRQTPPWIFSSKTYDPAHETPKPKAFKTYVRPIVEYAFSVWSPATDCHINHLEMVQQRAAQFVCNSYIRLLDDFITRLGHTTKERQC